MSVESSVLNHNPVPLVRLDELTGFLIERGDKRAIIYLDAKFKDGSDYTHSWLIYTGFFNSDPLFFSPFTGEWFGRSEIKDAWCRLLQPGETLRIDFHGE